MTKQLIMPKFMTKVIPTKKLLAGLIIYVLTLGIYLTVAITAVHQWRQSNIDNSPIVYITSTGEKYHKGYHYHGRNFSISLFEADEKGYVACRVCKPAIAPRYAGKPEFYFYHWIITTIFFSFAYWIIFNQINKQT